MKADVFFACLVAVLALGIYAEFDANDKVWGDISLIISRIMGGLTMSNFFLWGGFVFCVVWHFFSHGLVWTHSTNDVEGTLSQHVINLGLSGVSLCYFGMQAFA